MMQNPGGVGPLAPPVADGQQWMMMQQQQPIMQQPTQTLMQPQPQPQPVMIPPQKMMQPHQGFMPPQSVMQPQGFVNPGQALHSQQPQQQPDELKSLWIGDLLYWMDENYLYSCFAQSGEVAFAKVIRNKQTGHSEGYGFIEFVSHTAAEKALQSYNGVQMPQAEQLFRLNWASFGIGDRRPEAASDESIFVGDLASDVTDFVLHETFHSRYPSVKGAKVIIDTITGRSKGYGFVKFGDELEKTRAMTEMNGVYCSSRPMRLGTATPKKALGPAQQFNFKAAYQGSAYGGATSHNIASENDPNNTTVFVGGLDPNATDEDLRQVFSQFGEIVYVKIPFGKGCGFVQYTNRASAEDALHNLHGTIIGQQTIRLSWGRTPTKKQRQPQSGWGQPQMDPNQWSGGFYGYGQGHGPVQGYEGYGFTAPQDPGAYAYGTYQGYGIYPQQVS
ncbi:hypothetical protein O6H91_03G023500 [Diphasiastrum complanatum]|uniref:Uncharacterized protein n=1 Tax=Diphasiastrum complanatum TaxID=34168 RepID=A0ACC2E4N2_DIPCM|nr:hypothetical protein O6H91_03G023500 [Diphasiastrum complanatum]